MKKSLCAILMFIMLPGAFLFAGDFSFSASPVYSLRYGVQNEYVFVENLLDEEKKLSELNWQEHWLNFAGINLSAGWKNLKISSTTRAALPGKAGKVYDSDWLNLLRDYASLQNSLDPEISGIKTNYSETGCFLNYNFIESLELSYSVAETPELVISPVIGFDYNNSKYTSLGGEVWAGNTKYNTAGNYKGQYNGDGDSSSHFDWAEDHIVLELSRISVFTWLGFRAEYTPVKNINLNTSLGFCPYANIQSLDFHPERSTYFLDKMQSFFCGIKASIKATWTPCGNSHHSLYAGFDAMSTANIPGITYICNDGSGDFLLSNTNTSGSSFQWLEFTAGYRFSL